MAITVLYFITAAGTTAWPLNGIIFEARREAMAQKGVAPGQSGGHTAGAQDHPGGEES